MFIYYYYYYYYYDDYFPLFFLNPTRLVSLFALCFTSRATTKQLTTLDQFKSLFPLSRIASSIHEPFKSSSIRLVASIRIGSVYLVFFLLISRSDC